MPNSHLQSKTLPIIYSPRKLIFFKLKFLISACSSRRNSRRNYKVLALFVRLRFKKLKLKQNHPLGLFSFSPTKWVILNNIWSNCCFSAAYYRRRYLSQRNSAREFCKNTLMGFALGQTSSQRPGMMYITVVLTSHVCWRIHSKVNLSMQRLLLNESCSKCWW